MVRRKVSETPFAVYCWLIQVLIVLSLASVAVWLSMRPRNPKFTITSIYIPDMGNQNFSEVQRKETVRNNSLALVLEITNPNNGITICYVDINMKLHDGSLLVGIKSVDTFCQGQKKTVTREVLIDADQQLWGANMGGHGGFRVAVETMLQYQIFKWKTKIHHMGFEGFVRNGTKGNITESIYLHKAL